CHHHRALFQKAAESSSILAKGPEFPLLSAPIPSVNMEASVRIRFLAEQILPLQMDRLPPLLVPKVGLLKNLKVRRLRKNCHRCLNPNREILCSQLSRRVSTKIT